MVREFDPEKHYLGALCRHGHGWQDSKQSLWYKKNDKCVECVAIRCSKYRKKNADHIKVWKKQWYEENKERISEQEKQRRAANPDLWRQKSLDYYYSNHELCKARNRARAARQADFNRERAKAYYYQHRDAIKIKARNYRKRNRPLLNDINRLNRGLRANQHSVKIKSSQLKAHYARFGEGCAYCRAKLPPTLDHFLPLSKGGVHCLGNIVPACVTCNRRKQAQDPFEWYKAQPFYSAKQWRFILKTLGRSQDNYNQLPLF